MLLSNLMVAPVLRLSLPSTCVHVWLLPLPLFRSHSNYCHHKHAILNDVIFFVSDIALVHDVTVWL